jgi:transcriptional regulator with XRE-family HTH domain
MSIADQLLIARDKLGVTQEWVATKAGVPRSVVGRVERGVVRTNVTTLEKLAAALGTTFTIGEAK